MLLKTEDTYPGFKGKDLKANLPVLPGGHPGQQGERAVKEYR